MATISQQRGKWKCQIRRKGVPSQSKVFNTRTEAVKWGRIVEAELDKLASPLPTVNTTMTVREMLQRYYEEESPKKAGGGKFDRARIKRLQDVFGSHRIHSLTHHELTQYKRNRLAAGASAQTVIHELNLIHRAYVIAQQEWGINFPRGIPKTNRPTPHKGRTSRVPDTVLADLMQCRSKELPHIVTIATETAMRSGEILSMTWENIDFENRTVLLPITKNGSARTVPLSSKAYEALQGVISDRTGKVFTMTPSACSKAFNRIMKRIGREDLRFHDLRHEAVSRLFEKGLNVIEVSRISGHKTLSQLNRYTHLNVHDLLGKLD